MDRKIPINDNYRTMWKKMYIAYFRPRKSPIDTEENHQNPIHYSKEPGWDSSWVFSEVFSVITKSHIRQVRRQLPT
jgi:hypothetical protein